MFSRRSGIQDPKKKGKAKETPKSPKETLSRIKIHCDCGFPNNLFIRGSGGGLSWERGKPLKNVTPAQWIYETNEPFTQIEFKILVNDQHFEKGNNHTLAFGEKIEVSPQF